MTEDQPAKEPIRGKASISLSGSTSAVISGTAEGKQTFSLAPGDRRKQEALDHKHWKERTQHEHDLAEARKDNDARRRRETVMFGGFVVVVAVAFIGSCYGTFLSTDPETKKTSQSILTLIIGGLVGYWTGKKTSGG